jgi:hypothetical protein
MGHEIESSQGGCYYDEQYKCRPGWNGEGISHPHLHKRPGFETRQGIHKVVIENRPIDVPARWLGRNFYITTGSQFMIDSNHLRLGPTWLCPI